MDPLQERLTRAGLRVIGNRGFVLGGGHAVELHGMAARPSEDIDLFSAERGSPAAVADDLISAYEHEGFSVSVRLRTADLVQMDVADAQGESCQVDLGVFWCAHAPVLLDVGPVLHPDDAVAGKMDALFNRWAPRDFLDVDSILNSGRYTRQELMAVAGEHNPGFSPDLFSESLSYLRRIPDREFTAYGASHEQIESMRRGFANWEGELHTHRS
jgi:Nucleotidyl transferase AbiEii toxin, Type IV TA system